MVKSRRYKKNKKQSRKLKSGGKKNQLNNMQLLTTQVAGGPFSYTSVLAPGASTINQSGGVAPAPSSPATVYPYQTTNASSLAASLKSFGDAIFSLTQTTATGIEAAESAQIAVNSQMAAARAMDTAAKTVLANLAGDVNVGTPGLFNTLLAPMVYTPPPIVPAPAPR